MANCSRSSPGASVNEVLVWDQQAGRSYDQLNLFVVILARKCMLIWKLCPLSEKILRGQSDGLASATGLMSAREPRALAR